MFTVTTFTREACTSNSHDGQSAQPAGSRCALQPCAWTISVRSAAAAMGTLATEQTGQRVPQFQWSAYTYSLSNSTSKSSSPGGSPPQQDQRHGGAPAQQGLAGRRRQQTRAAGARKEPNVRCVSTQLQRADKCTKQGLWERIMWMPLGASGRRPPTEPGPPRPALATLVVVLCACLSPLTLSRKPCRSCLPRLTLLPLLPTHPPSLPPSARSLSCLQPAQLSHQHAMWHQHAQLLVSEHQPHFEVNSVQAGELHVERRAQGASTCLLPPSIEGQLSCPLRAPEQGFAVYQPGAALTEHAHKAPTSGSRSNPTPPGRWPQPALAAAAQSGWRPG